MLHKVWNSKGEMPYRFPRSSVKFQGHTVQNITDFDPNWAFPDYRPVAAFKSLRFALFLNIGLISASFISVGNMDWLTHWLKRSQYGFAIWDPHNFKNLAFRPSWPIALFASRLLIYLWKMSTETTLKSNTLPDVILFLINSTLLCDECLSMISTKSIVSKPSYSCLYWAREE